LSALRIEGGVIELAARGPGAAMIPANFSGMTTRGVARAITLPLKGDALV